VIKDATRCLLAGADRAKTRQAESESRSSSMNVFPSILRDLFETHFRYDIESRRVLEQRFPGHGEVGCVGDMPDSQHGMKSP
jgi:hypothetical protein